MPVERAGHLREQGWESWEDSKKMVNYINNPPWHSHQCRDVLKKRNQCNPPENYILMGFFYSTCPGFNRVQSKRWDPRDIYAGGYPVAQKGESKESTGVMAKQVSKSSSKSNATLVQKLKSHMETVCGRSEGEGMVWPLTKALQWQFGSANFCLPTPRQSPDIVWPKTQVCRINPVQ